MGKQDVADQSACRRPVSDLILLKESLSLFLGLMLNMVVVGLL